VPPVFRGKILETLELRRLSAICDSVSKRCGAAHEVSPCETRSPGFAVACTLDQVVKDPCDYLWDNLYVYMLAHLIVANQGEKMSVPRGLSSELGIPRPQLPQSTVKQPKSGHLRVENRSGSMRGIGIFRQLTTVDPVSVRV
jgi:hypothetical protein